MSFTIDPERLLQAHGREGQMINPVLFFTIPVVYFYQ